MKKNMIYQYRNSKTSGEFRRQKKIKKQELKAMFPGYELIQVYDLKVTEKELKAK